MSWHTIQEAAQKLELHVATVRQLCVSGKIRHRRIGPRGGKIRISDAAIEEYLASCEVGGPGQGADAAKPKREKKKPTGGRPDGRPLKYQW